MAKPASSTSGQNNQAQPQAPVDAMTNSLNRLSIKETSQNLPPNPDLLKNAPKKAKKSRKAKKAKKAASPDNNEVPSNPKAQKKQSKKERKAQDIKEANDYFESSGLNDVDHFNEVLEFCGLERQNTVTQCKKVYQASGYHINIFDYTAFKKDIIFTDKREFIAYTRKSKKFFPLHEAKHSFLKLMLEFLGEIRP